VNFDTLFEVVKRDAIELSFDNPQRDANLRLSNEALFHLPLLALTILLLASDRRKPKTDELGQLVGECFERTFIGFKGSSQHLGWSANLRVRTVRALTFLETARLVTVDAVSQRIGIGELGKKVIDAALEKEDSDLGYMLRVIERSYRNITTERQISLGL
jgi:hypothetical protein